MENTTENVRPYCVLYHRNCRLFSLQASWSETKHECDGMKGGTAQGVQCITRNVKWAVLS